MTKMNEMQSTAPVLEFGVQPETQNHEDTSMNMPVVKSEEDKMIQAANLSEEDLKQVDDFVEQIDISNISAIMNYGVGTQKKLADFSEKTLESVRTKDMGEVGGIVTDLIVQLNNFDSENEKKKGFFRRIVQSGQNRVTELKARYTDVETNVENITNELEKHQVTLMKDVEMLDSIYDMNIGYYKELTMYILAGKKKLEIIRGTDLENAKKKANETGLQEDAQAAKDLADQCDRFEKKLHDLELTRTVAMQTGPQIRLMQASDATMAEKIQSTIINTIPLWKNQMVIAIGIEHGKQAAKAQREISNATNELLKKNADMLKIATVETAKEAERGIVDIDTLKHTNEQLVATLNEVLKIQTDGKEKRKKAEQELMQIEDQLKNKLLEASRR